MRHAGKLASWIAGKFGYTHRDSSADRRPIIVRGFNAAAVNRLTQNWTTTNLSSDAELRYALPTLRARSRDQAINNDYAKKFIHLCKINVVGPSGVTLQVRPKDDNGLIDKPAGQAIEAAWREWGSAPNCDVTGRLSWLDIQKLFIESIMRDGEVIIRLARGYAGNKFKFALQLLEADHLDETLNTELPNGAIIRMGVELNEWRRPVAYHILTKHPGDWAYTASIRTQNRERIPADEIIHAYLTDRIGQTRGIPWMACAMTRLNNLGAYEEAEIIASRVSASKMGIVYTPSGTDYQGDDKQDNNIIQEVEPGLITQLPHGWEFKEFDPTHPGQNFEGFIKATLRGIASGLGVSYNSLASDLESVNYSSMRAGSIEERDAWKILQAFTIQTLCQPIFAEWLKLSILVQAIPLPNVKSDKYSAAYWQPRGWDWVDPMRDEEANILAINNGLKSRTMIAMERGFDLEDIADQLAAEEKMFKEKGVALAKPNQPSVGVSVSADADDDASADDKEKSKGGKLYAVSQQ